MRILVVGNFSDRRCGFQNFSLQTVTALNRAGHDVLSVDGTYSQVYERQQEGLGLLHSFLPVWTHPENADVIHVVWHPATLNHYAGCDWEAIRAMASPRKIVLSVWNGCPAAHCPFTDLMDIRWGVLHDPVKEPNHVQIWYPIPDWVTELPPPDKDFTVGYTGVRMEGVAALQDLCDHYGWAWNGSVPGGEWLTQEEEIRRLARSTVNVCWYGAEHDDRSGGAMICLASKRPLLTNDVRMFDHLKRYEHEHYRSENTNEALEGSLLALEEIFQKRGPGAYRMARDVVRDMSWTRACERLQIGWAMKGARS